MVSLPDLEASPLAKQDGRSSNIFRYPLTPKRSKTHIDHLMYQKVSNGLTKRIHDRQPESEFSERVSGNLRMEMKLLMLGVHEKVGFHGRRGELNANQDET